jgi:hypothetical protein
VTGIREGAKTRFIRWKGFTLGLIEGAFIAKM